MAASLIAAPDEPAAGAAEPPKGAAEPPKGAAEPPPEMRAFWVVWAGLLASFTGSGLTRFGLSVWVYQGSRDAEAFALLLFAGIVPLSLGSLIAGPLVDRLDRRRVLVVATAVSRLPTLLVLLLWWQGGLETWHLYLALAVNGLANAFVLPAFDASVRLMVPADRLLRASGYSQVMQSLGIVVGPPLAGGLLVAFGLGSVLAVDLAGAVLALVALALVRIPSPPRTLVRGPSSVLQDFAFGLRYVFARPAFLLLSGLLALTVFASAFVYALSGPLVLGLGDEASIGVVYAAFGIASVVGALAIGRLSAGVRRMPGILWTTGAVGLGTLLMGIVPDLVWIGATVVLVGAAQSALLTLNRVVFQEHAAPEVLGRVFAFRMVVTAAAQSAGILASGALAARVFEPLMAPGGALAPSLGGWIGTGEGRGAALMLIVAGLALTVVTLAAASSRRVRRIEGGLPPSG